MIKRLLATLWMVALASSCLAAVETYEFENEVQRERYQQFIAELRCPKCQNQNLAGSDAPIAEDLRSELYRMLQEQRSDKEIVDYMVDRYGDFILYRPRFNPQTALLWLAPVLFLVLGGVAIARVYRRQRYPEQVAEDDRPLDEAERRRLQQLLSQQPSAVDSPADKDRVND